MTIGDKVNPEWLTKGFDPGTIKGEDDVQGWINAIGKNLGVNAGQQNKHREGSKEYLDYQKRFADKGEYGPSVLSISDSEVAALVAKYAGTGVRKYTNDKWDGREIITINDNEIGLYVNNLNGKSVLASNFIIHYGNKGYHIVPNYSKK